MIKAANMVLKAGICSLRSVFRSIFPSVTYHTLNAKRKLLQMPLAAILIGAEVNITELVQGIDYLKVSHFLGALATKRETNTPSLSKTDLNSLLLLAQSDRERELVKYTAFRASGMTKSSARRHFGFQNLSERVSKVEECIQEAESIRQCIDTLSRVKEAAIMQEFIISACITLFTTTGFGAIITWKKAR